MTVEITKEERDMLLKMCGIAIYNGNHDEAKAFAPNGSEYKIICKLFNKVNFAKGKDD